MPNFLQYMMPAFEFYSFGIGQNKNTNRNVASPLCPRVSIFAAECVRFDRHARQRFLSFVWHALFSSYVIHTVDCVIFQ
jgi:hypothetical protein